jgi:leucyl-tRNA synthetase
LSPSAYPILVVTSDAAKGVSTDDLRTCAIADAYARYRRADGDAVALVVHGGARSSDDRLDSLRRQSQAMGFSVEWQVDDYTEICRWSQRLFLLLFQCGMVYERQRRTHSTRGSEWLLRTSAYVEDCYENLSALTGWDEATVAAQRTALGRVEGVEIEAATIDGGQLTVFGLTAEDIRDAAFIAVSPNHPVLDTWIFEESIAAELACLRDSRWLIAEGNPEEIEMLDTKWLMSVPGCERLLPVVISPHLDRHVGATAMLGVPQRDAIAAAIASRLSDHSPGGFRVNGRSATPKQAARYAAADLQINDTDGVPIPLVRCDACGLLPVPVADLPVIPEGQSVTPQSGDSVVDRESSLDCECPSCGGRARQEDGALGREMVPPWLRLPDGALPACPVDDESLTREFRATLPIRQILLGPDSAIYVLSMRAMAKMLRDQGTLEFLLDGEPFTKASAHGGMTFQGHGQDERSADALLVEWVTRWGVDAVRLAIMRAAASRNRATLTSSEVELCYRLLQRLHQYAATRIESTSMGSATMEIDTSDRLRRRLAAWCNTATRKVGDDVEHLRMHKATHNAMRLLVRIEDYERHMGKRHPTPADEAALVVALPRLIRLIAPLAPHIAEELWTLTGEDSSLDTAGWPASRRRPTLEGPYT